MTKLKVLKSQRKSYLSKAKSNLLSYKSEIDRFNIELNKMIKSYEDGGIKVNKSHLNRAWEIAINNYKKGNYVKASHFLLLTLLTGSILLNRNKALTDSFRASTKFSNSEGHMLMCGLLSSESKNSSLFHKSKSKELSDKIMGIKKLNKFFKLGDGLDERTADTLFDFIQTCKNPYIKSATSAISSIYNNM